jgi:hypothetical protein
MSSTSNTYSSGIVLGTVLAAIISWTSYHSVGWAILHGFLGWFFIIWWCFQ